jgi:hypothetical protein
MKCCFNASKGHANSISAYWASKKRLRRRRLSQVLSRRMDLTTRNLPSECFKMRLRWCRWSNVSWCQKAIRRYFLHSVHSKKRFRKSRESDVLSRQMAERTHNLPSERVKNQLCWLRWSDISWFRKDIWKHFLNSGHWKKRFEGSRGSDVLIRRMAKRPHKLPSRSLKNDFGEVDEEMFQDIANSFSASWSSKTTT